VDECKPLLTGTILGAKFQKSESIRPVDWGYMFLNWFAINIARFIVVERGAG